MAASLSSNAGRDARAEGAENSYFFRRVGNAMGLALGPSFYNFFEVFDVSRPRHKRLSKRYR